MLNHYHPSIAMQRLMLAFVLCLIGTTVSSCGASKSLNSSVSSAKGSPGTAPLFINEANFTEEFDTHVLPVIEQGTKGYFTGVDGAQLYHMAFEHPLAKARIVIVPGFTENTLKYRELIYNFYQAGYSVYIFDPRSQGKSDRLVADREIVWIARWEDYVTDLKTFIHTIVPHDEKPVLIFSHSMGGAVVADALTSEPDLARAAVINAPIVGLNTGKYPLAIAKSLAYGAVLLGKGKSYSTGQAPYDGDVWTIDVASTSSVPRHERYKRDIEVADEQQGGSSFNWVKQVFIMNDKMAKESVVSKVTTPILMGQAGHDGFALPGAQAKYCSMAKNCMLRSQPSSRHEIFNEVDAIRNPWIQEILAFYANRLDP